MRCSGKSMQVSAIHSDLEKAWCVLLCFFLLCVPSWGRAKEAPSEKSVTPIYEWNGKEELTPEEKYAMQWQEIFISDLGTYSFNTQFGFINPEDSNELVLKVRAIYKDRDLLKRLKEEYAVKLAEGSIPLASEMELHLHMKEKEYAITKVSIYDQKHQLISEAERTPVYKKIPPNSFVQAMYQIGGKFLEYQKSFGKK